MLNKIIEILNDYQAAHDRDIISLSDEQIAEIRAGITYLEELNNMGLVGVNDNLKKRVDVLQNAIIDSSSSVTSSDIRVTRKDFLEIYNKVMEGMAADCDNDIYEEGKYHNMIYGKDFTVHWNGIYCDCLDGCHPCNYLIPAIENIEVDADGEEVDL